MRPIYNISEFNNAKSTDKLPCECYNCGSTFLVLKKLIKQELRENNGRRKFCSKICADSYQRNKEVVKCVNCNIEVSKYPNQVKKYKNNFCSKSCSTTYNNKNKKHGTKRSKLEVWLEGQLITLYPNLKIHFNEKEVIGSELDIYIPSLNLAFELNGIFHYEPIYGVNKLQQIQENDISKSKACHDYKIDLCVIDASKQKRFNHKTSQKYLDIITNIIKKRLSTI